MTGTVLSTLVDEVNGGDSIGSTLKFQLINFYKALVEQSRPWMVLRYTDTSVSVTAGNTWQTAISLSGITRFNRFHGDFPIRLFDGNNRIERYRRVPMDERLMYKDVPNTFCYEEATKTLYLNGTVAFGGTLYIRHIKDSADIENTDTSEWVFPSWSHGLLAFGAAAAHKGGIDYDDVNERMSPQNEAMAQAIISRLSTWDAELQQSEIENFDPTRSQDDDYRPNAIKIH